MDKLTFEVMLAHSPLAPLEYGPPTPLHRVEVNVLHVGCVSSNNAYRVKGTRDALIVLLVPSKRAPGKPPRRCMACDKLVVEDYTDG